MTVSAGVNWEKIDNGYFPVITCLVLACSGRLTAVSTGRFQPMPALGTVSTARHLPAQETGQSKHFDSNYTWLTLAFNGLRVWKFIIMISE